MDEDDDIIVLINGEEYTITIQPPPYAGRNVNVTDHTINLLPYNRRGDYQVFVGSDQVGMFCPWVEDNYMCSAGAAVYFTHTDPNEAIRKAVELFLEWKRSELRLQAQEG